ncbi:tetratricopeptide repeat protein [Pseudodesulfovibrio tunisiensis]|uniref:tetratricopeptide repeat protein n=1 Tax=Pseudodesulfovibrio tunisiensis TaxID=463192 RepID=UPI001FB1B210|nr:tetratricopeptide repeat protein [Pseudodesulfovibrio tunisiensis]
MQQNQGNSLHRTLAAGLLLLAALTLSACAGKQTAPPAPPQPMSEQASVTYNYLLYQELAQELQRQAGSGASRAEIGALREQARQALDQVLNAAPTPELYLEKAALLWNDEGAAGSREALRQGLDRFPDNRMLTVYLANSYLMERRVDDAVAIMESYLSDRPGDHAAREQLGQMLLDAGRPAQALDELKKVPSADRSPDGLYVMGRAQAMLGMGKQAVANLKRAVKADPEFTEAMAELAYQYEIMKDYVLAEETYVRILEQEPDHPQVRLRLINLNLKLNNIAKALDTALSGPPTKSFILDSVLVFINDGFYAQASTVLDRLATGSDIPAEYHFYKAVIANEGENDPAKALRNLDKVHEDDRFYPHALRFRAQLLNAMGEYDKALAEARKGKRLFPDGPEFFILESAIQSGNNRIGEAMAVLRDGAAKLGETPEIMYELALLLDRTGDRKASLEVMEKVLKKHPDNANALNYVGYTLAEEGLDLDRALVLVENASRQEPGNGYIMDSVAWVLFKRGEHAKAWQRIQEAVELEDRDATIWEHYGDIAKAAGHAKAARKGYRKSLELKTEHPDRVRGKLNSL